MDATNNWSITCNKTWPRDKQGGKDTTIKQSGGTKVLLGMWLISISITSLDNLDNYTPLTAWIFKVSILRIHFQTICCQISINNCFLDWNSELVYVLNVFKHALHFSLGIQLQLRPLHPYYKVKRNQRKFKVMRTQHLMFITSHLTDHHSQCHD